METLTLLQTRGGLPLTKKFTPETEESFAGSKYYTVRSAKVESITGLTKILSRLSDNVDMAYIRGQLNDEGKKSYVSREEINFDDVPRHLIAFDVDSAETTYDPIFDTEAACVHWVEEHLPAEFQGASFVYQLTSSAGVKPGLRVRLWFWLETPRTNQEIKPWVKSIKSDENKLDDSLFDSVHLHYTAAPIFEGMSDPTGGDRVGLCQGYTDKVEGFDPFVNSDETFSFDNVRLDPFLLVARPMDLTRTEIVAYLDAGTETGAIDADDYEDWITVGRCLHHQFKGDIEGWEIWDNWSQLSTKYLSPKETQYRYRTFDRAVQRGKRPQTFATIVYKVKDAGGSVDSLALTKQVINDAETEQEVLDALARFDGSIAESKAVQTSGMLKMNTLIAAAGIASEHQYKPHEVKKRVRELREDNAKVNAADLEYELAYFSVIQLAGDADRVMYFAKSFWRFDEGVWRPLDEAALSNAILELLKGNDGGNELRYLRDQVRKSGQKTSALVSGIQTVLAARFGCDVHTDPLNLNGNRDSAKSVINCTNGELWIDSQGNLEFTEHDPRHLLTHKIATHYDPNAPAPLWQQTLDTVFKNAEDKDDLIRHVEELLGYMIQSSRNAEALWIMFHGETGANGKSLLAGVLSGLLGEAALSMSLDDLAKSAHGTSSLVGKLALIDDDFSANTPLADGWLKKLSESKQLSVNPKHKDTFTFRSKVITVHLTNRWPKSKTFDGGLQRRAQIIPFNYQIPVGERRAGLDRTLVAEEGAGILNRLVQGYLRVQARGGRFDMPVDCKRALNEWIGEAADATGFLQDHIETVPFEDIKVCIRDELFQEYRYWANSNGAYPLGARAFLNEVRDLAPVLGLTVKQIRLKGQTNAKYFLTGAKLKNPQATTLSAFETTTTNDKKESNHE